MPDKKSKYPICIDIDNVIAETDEVIRRLIKEHTECAVNLDYQDIVNFDYWRCKDKFGAGINKAQWGKIHEAFSTPDCLLAISPNSAAQESLQKLAESFEVHIVTSRFPNTREITLKWLGEHRLPFEFFHISKHREKHLLPLQFCAVIEDDYEQAVMFSKAGTKAFLIEHPWNNAQAPANGVWLAKNWGDVIEKVERYCLPVAGS